MGFEEDKHKQEGAVEHAVEAPVEGAESPEVLIAKAQQEVDDLKKEGNKGLWELVQKTGEPVPAAVADELVAIAGEGNDAKETLSAAVTAVAEQQEYQKRQYKYMTSSGELIGKAEVSLGEWDDEYKGRVLEKLSIQGDRGSVDVLALANQHQSRIVMRDTYVDPTTGERGVWHCAFKSKKILTPPLDSPLGVAILLHELGHADQFHDEALVNYQSFYSSGDRISEIKTPEYSQVRSAVDSVLNVIPKASELLNEEKYQRVKDLESSFRKQNDTVTDLRRQEEETESALEHYVQTWVYNHILTNPGRESIKNFCRESEEELNHTNWDPELRKQKSTELVKQLEDFGFVFGENLIVKEDSDISFLERRKLSSEGSRQQQVPLLPKSMIDVFDADRFIDKPSIVTELKNISIRYDSATGITEITMRAPMTFEGVYNMSLRVPMTSEAYAEYQREYQTRQDAIQQAEQLLQEQRLILDKILVEQTKLVPESGVLDVIQLSKRILEQDATWRAFRWIKDINKRAGVDLRQDISIPEKASMVIRDKEDCETATVESLERSDEPKQVTTNIIDEYVAAWKSHDAWKFRKPKRDAA